MFTSFNYFFFNSHPFLTGHQPTNQFDKDTTEFDREHVTAEALTIHLQCQFVSIRFIFYTSTMNTTIHFHFGCRLRLVICWRSRYNIFFCCKNVTFRYTHATNELQLNCIFSARSFYLFRSVNSCEQCKPHADSDWCIHKHFCHLATLPIRYRK